MNIQEVYQIYKLYPLVTTDTRNCKPGSIFFALRGGNFDGNNFVQEALKQGCEYAVCDSPDVPENERIIHVKDSLATLQELANYHRKELNIPVIAITGSNGKTTTKELTAAVLSSKYNILYTQGNLNNHIGVPLTLLQLKPEHEFAIIEMGANHPGEIRRLTEIAEPNYGIITNVGKAHLEGFGSFEGVIQTKGELYDYLRKTGGIAFINHENTHLEAIAGDLNKIYYGKTSESFVWGNTENAFPFLTFNWYKEKQSFHVKTQLVGEYNLENAIAAIAVGVYLDVEALTICKAIETYSPTNNRSQFIETSHNKLIIDAYNANPTSMLVALDNFKKMEVSPKMLILGDMKELGNYSHDEHQKIADFIAESNFDRAYLCGPEFYSLNINQEHYISFETTDSLIQFIKSEQIKGYFILIKGSRGNQLEKSIDFL